MNKTLDELRYEIKQLKSVIKFNSKKVKPPSNEISKHEALFYKYMKLSNDRNY